MIYTITYVVLGIQAFIGLIILYNWISDAHWEKETVYLDVNVEENDEY